MLLYAAPAVVVKGFEVRRLDQGITLRIDSEAEHPDDFSL
jgi:hypothetical protein